MTVHPKILAITTSSPRRAGVAVATVQIPSAPPGNYTTSDVEAVAEVVGRENYRADLPTIVEQLLQATATNPADLLRVVVDIGPGRHNDADVGVATAVDLARRHRIPIVPLSAFSILECKHGSQDVVINIDVGNGFVAALRFADGDALDGPTLRSATADEVDHEVTLGGDYDRDPVDGPDVRTLVELADRRLDDVVPVDDIRVLTADTVGEWVNP